MKFNSLPKFVLTLCYSFDGWLIGGAVGYALRETNEHPRDFDVVVPFERWREAALVIPHDAMVNTFGGFKILTEFVGNKSVMVDVWPGTVQGVLTHTAMKPRALHLPTGTLITTTKLALQLPEEVAVNAG